MSATIADILSFMEIEETCVDGEAKHGYDVPPTHVWRPRSPVDIEIAYWDREALGVKLRRSAAQLDLATLHALRVGGTISILLSNAACLSVSKIPDVATARLLALAITLRVQHLDADDATAAHKLLDGYLGITGY